jgi:hypothetical protein
MFFSGVGRQLVPGLNVHILDSWAWEFFSARACKSHHRNHPSREHLIRKESEQASA